MQYARVCGVTCPPYLRFLPHCVILLSEGGRSEPVYQRIVNDSFNGSPIMTRVDFVSGETEYAVAESMVPGVASSSLDANSPVWKIRLMVVAMCRWELSSLPESDITIVGKIKKVDG